MASHASSKFDFSILADLVIQLIHSNELAALFALELGGLAFLQQRISELSSRKLDDDSAVMRALRRFPTVAAFSGVLDGDEPNTSEATSKLQV